MFERFTDRARKVMALANQEARRLNHREIGPEHILLGLLKEGTGVAAIVLKKCEVDTSGACTEAERLRKPGAEVVPERRLSQTRQAKRVIECAAEEARNLNHNYLGTEHLLLGLLRTEAGVTQDMLANLGLNFDQTREQIVGLLGPSTAPVAPPGRCERVPEPSRDPCSPAKPVSQSFDDRVRKVMELANLEAQRRNHECTGTEHLLLGLVMEGSAAGVDALKRLQVDPGKVRLEIERIAKPRPGMAAIVKPPYSPRAMKATELAMEFARYLGHSPVRAEHLLLGLLRTSDSMAAQVLINVGLNLDQVRDEVLDWLRAAEAEPPAGPSDTG